MNINEIFPILVLYNSRLEESETIKSIENTSDSIKEIFVFDNSPVQNYHEDSFKFKRLNIHYQSDISNPGLSAAYNSALKTAKEKGFKWLLLLDQDTVFSQLYFDEINSLKIDNCVAVIPKVKSIDGTFTIAPVEMRLGGFIKPLKLRSGVTQGSITGINSGTLLNIDYMASIGGFSEKYTLDMLDHWYFRKIARDKKNICILDSSIYQNLSVSENFEKNVTVSRYKQMTSSERLFFKDEILMSYGIYKFKLFARFLKQLKYENKQYAKITLQEFLKM